MSILLYYIEKIEKKIYDLYIPRKIEVNILLWLGFNILLAYLIYKNMPVLEGDVSESWQITFQDPATPLMEGILRFHSILLFVTLCIFIFVCWMLSRVLYLFNFKKQQKSNVKFTSNDILEIIWTIIPTIILIFLSIPSFHLLYAAEDSVDPEYTFKVIGHQWYWTYEVSDCYTYRTKPETETYQFDSYMIPSDELTIGFYRLLDTDYRLIIPIDTPIRILVTSADVLHSWSIPSLGIKIDACPGRLNEIFTILKRTGVFYGQCSEICGINHAFMPIVIKGVPRQDFLFYAYDYIPGFFENIFLIDFKEYLEQEDKDAPLKRKLLHEILESVCHDMVGDILKDERYSDIERLQRYALFTKLSLNSPEQIEELKKKRERIRKFVE